MNALRRALAICAIFGMLLAACGDDDDTATDDPDGAGTTDPTDPDAPDDDEAATSDLVVTFSDGGLELSADSIASGVVEVTFENEADAFNEVELSHVEDGTSEEQFAEAFAVTIGGGPFPDFAIKNAGVAADPDSTTSSTVVLEAGEYIVWVLPEEPDGEEPDGEGPDDDASEAPEGEDDGDGGEGEGEGPPPEAFVTTTLTVTEDESDAEFPETDGTITARDYSFDVDVSGSGTFTFANEGPDQFHHAVVVDFGTADPDAVEAGFPEFLASEGEGEPPEGIDPTQIDFEFAATGVFGPNSMSTFEADFEDGNTYAVVCFIGDRSGGPPHAIAYDMFEVFQAG